MNGQTGRMVGDLPFSRKEFWKYVIPRGMIAGAGIYAVLECFMVLSVYQWTAFHLSLMILAVLAAGRIDPGFCQNREWDERRRKRGGSMKRAVLKKIYRIGAGWLLMLLVLCSLAIPFPSKAAQIPDERLGPRLADQEELLTTEEQEELLARLDEISERQQCDVVIVTVASIEGKTATEYADDYFDYQGYGYGEKSDGILLLVGMKERVWAISTHGSLGISAFTDAGLDYIKEDVQFQLKLDNYAKAFRTFASLCDQFLTAAHKGKPYDVGNLPIKHASPSILIFLFPIGILIMAWKSRSKKRSLKSVVKKTGAISYKVPNSLHLWVDEDRITGSHVTKRKRHEESRDRGGSGGSSGGSTTHTSSSGRTHGGTSGTF